MRQLFRLDHTASRHPSVAAWFEDHPGPLGDLAMRWFDSLRQCGNDVQEVLHDDQPTVCVDGAAFAYVAVYKNHASVGFFQGSELADPECLLEGSGKFMRHVKLRSGVEVDAAALLALIHAAYANVKERLASE